LHKGLNVSAEQTDISAIADRLHEAAQSRVPVEPIAGNLPKGDLGAAYAVQSHNTKRGLAGGRRLVGRKIGLTSHVVQRQLGVDQPDYGMLFADMAYGDGDTVPIANFVQPKVEAEIALVLGKDLDRDRHTTADIIDATAYALPCVEIVDSRIADWRISICDTIADNASSGAFVLGSSPKPLSDIDLRLCGMVLEQNGEPVSTGVGAACLGNPLNAARWLADVMAATDWPLRADDIVLTGALGPMVAVSGGDRIDVRISGLGSLGFMFGRSLENGQ
jgi:2-keto-4-pentenoate hydratase